MFSTRLKSIPGVVRPLLLAVLRGHYPAIKALLESSIEAFDVASLHQKSQQNIPAGGFCPEQPSEEFKAIVNNGRVLLEHALQYLERRNLQEALDALELFLVQTFVPSRSQQVSIVAVFDTWKEFQRDDQRKGDKGILHQILCAGKTTFVSCPNGVAVYASGSHRFFPNDFDLDGKALNKALLDEEKPGVPFQLRRKPVLTPLTANRQRLLACHTPSIAADFGTGSLAGDELARVMLLGEDGGGLENHELSYEKDGELVITLLKEIEAFIDHLEQATLMDVRRRDVLQWMINRFIDAARGPLPTEEEETEAKKGERALVGRRQEQVWVMPNRAEAKEDEDEWEEAPQERIVPRSLGPVGYHIHQVIEEVLDYFTRLRMAREAVRDRLDWERDPDEQSRADVEDDGVDPREVERARCLRFGQEHHDGGTPVQMMQPLPSVAALNTVEDKEDGSEEEVPPSPAPSVLDLEGGPEDEEDEQKADEGRGHSVAPQVEQRGLRARAFRFLGRGRKEKKAGEGAQAKINFEP